MKKEIKFKAQGRKDYIGFQWFVCSENGFKYKALNAEHALAMYNQKTSSKSHQQHLA